MGEVYRAHDARLGRDVAIKVLPKQFDADPDRVHRFEQEARAIAALNHPHICQIHDVGPGYLVLEYIEGAPLGGPLAAGRSGAARVAGRRRPPRGTSERHPPSRFETGQHPGHYGRARKGPRLRPGEGHDRGAGRHTHDRRHRGGHGHVHVTGTGARESSSTRAPTCSVWARSCTDALRHSRVWRRHRRLRS